MSAARRKVAVVTGASAGIGAAVTQGLAAAGYSVVAGARREDELRRVAAAAEAVAVALDVTDPASVERFVAAARATAAERASSGHVDLLVNNAGLSLGLDPIATARDEDWETMFRTNVMGVLRLTRALLPDLVASGDGHVVDLGSIAGFETYPGGAGYTASKHALRAVTRTLRLELLGQPVRVTEISPGLVETEFSLVRFGGDRERAAATYAGMEPLLAADVADCVVWAVTRPSHVNIDEIVVRPRDQAAATLVHRRPR